MALGKVLCDTQQVHHLPGVWDAEMVIRFGTHGGTPRHFSLHDKA